MVRHSLARRWLPPFLLAAIMLLFLIANRGAYKGYFDSDDFNNLNFTRHIDTSEFIGDLFSPRVFPKKARDWTNGKSAAWPERVVRPRKNCSRDLTFWSAGTSS